MVLLFTELQATGGINNLGTVFKYDLSKTGILENNINNDKTENNFCVYPNPNNGSFNIDFLNLFGEKQIEIYTINGEFLSRFSTSNDLFKIDLYPLFPKGIYLLKIKTDSEIFHSKVVVE